MVASLIADSKNNLILSILSLYSSFLRAFNSAFKSTLRLVKNFLICNDSLISSKTVEDSFERWTITSLFFSDSPFKILCMFPSPNELWAESTKLDS